MIRAALLAALLAVVPAPSAAHQTVIALPEHTTVAHVGDMVLVPLYDARGDVAQSGGALHKIGIRAIARRDLRHDIQATNRRTPAYQIPQAAGDRAVAFAAVRPGRAAVSIVLTLPQYRERCVSCRTVHFFFEISTPPPTLKTTHTHGDTENVTGFVRLDSVRNAALRESERRNGRADQWRRRSFNNAALGPSCEKKPAACAAGFAFAAAGITCRRRL
jgi:hypothetical protein